MLRCTPSRRSNPAATCGTYADASLSSIDPAIAPGFLCVQGAEAMRLLWRSDPAAAHFTAAKTYTAPWGLLDTLGGTMPCNGDRWSVAMISADSYERFEQPVQLRVEWRGNHRGKAFSVVTGYDVSTDAWPVHVYVEGIRCAGVVPAPAANETDAQAIGLAAVEAVIEECFSQGIF